MQWGGSTHHVVLMFTISTVLCRRPAGVIVATPRPGDVRLPATTPSTADAEASGRPLWFVFNGLAGRRDTADYNQSRLERGRALLPPQSASASPFSGSRVVGSRARCRERYGRQIGRTCFQHPTWNGVRVPSRHPSQRVTAVTAPERGHRREVDPPDDVERLAVSRCAERQIGTRDRIAQVLSPLIRAQSSPRLSTTTSGCARSIGQSSRRRLIHTGRSPARRLPSMSATGLSPTRPPRGVRRRARCMPRRSMTDEVCSSGRPHCTRPRRTRNRDAQSTCRDSHGRHPTAHQDGGRRCADLGAPQECPHTGPPERALPRAVGVGVSAARQSEPLEDAVTRVDPFLSVGTELG